MRHETVTSNITHVKKLIKKLFVPTAVTEC